MMRASRRWLAGLAAAALTLPLLAACGGSGKPALVVYNAQHEELISQVAKAFTKKTGIPVELRNGSDLELANQLATEGTASPADVFLTENSPGMTLVDSKHLFAKLDQTTLDQIPGQYRPDDGDWTGFAARSTVLVYNKAKITQSQLPASILDLAKPEWKGRISFSPTGADFQAIVSAVLATQGKQVTRAWLAGLKANGTVYDGNNVVLDSVNSGQTAAGVIYHYYWYRDQAESGANSKNTALHFFGHQDPGAFISVSGAGVLKAGHHSKDAQKFVDFLVSKQGQQVIARSNALEYTLNPGVDLGHGVKSLSQLQPPKVDVSDLNGPDVVNLMQEAGFL